MPQQQFKIAIANTIVTKVKGIYQDEEGKERPFSFELVQDRVSQKELEDAIMSRTENATEFLKRVTKDWRNQRLVLIEDGEGKTTPAPWSDEAFDALLSISGMPGYCWGAYRDQVLARAKN